MDKEKAPQESASTMNRFWVFPLLWGVLGALFPTLAALEGMAPLLPVLMSALGPTYSVLHSLGQALAASAPVGLVVGALVGAGFGAWDAVRNGRAPRDKSQLVKNLAWCLLYAHAFILVDMLLAYAWFTRGSPGFALTPLTAFLPALFCLVAILWGTIRTVTTNEVLSPRVLGAKLKRSVSVEEAL